MFLFIANYLKLLKFKIISKNIKFFNMKPNVITTVLT